MFYVVAKCTFIGNILHNENKMLTFSLSPTQPQL